MKPLIVTIETGDDKFDIRQIGDRQVREQRGHVQQPDKKYPVEFKFNVGREQLQPYPPGEYVISPSSYRIGKYSKLELNPFELTLEPVQRKAA